MSRQSWLTYEDAFAAVTRLREIYPQSRFDIVTTTATTGHYLVEARIWQGPRHRRQVMRASTPAQLAGLFPSAV